MRARLASALLDATARQATLALYYSRLVDQSLLEAQAPGGARRAQPDRARHPRHAGAGLRRHPDAAAGGAARPAREPAAGGGAQPRDRRRSRAHAPGRGAPLGGGAAAAFRRARGRGRGAAPHGRSGAADRTTCRSSWSLDELPAFDAGVEREIIGIAQEALTNAVRHARARRIVVRAGARARRRLPAVGGRRWPRHRPRSRRRRLRHDQHARARRAHRRVADVRHRAARRHRSRAGLAAGGVLDSASRPMAIAEARVGAAGGRRARARGCWSSTITRCCGPASPTSSTRSPTSKSSPRRPTAATAIEAFLVASARRRADGPADAGDGRRRGGPPDSRDRSAGARRSC